MEKHINKKSIFLVASFVLLALSFGAVNLKTNVFNKLELVEAWSGTQTPSVDDSYYENIRGMTGTDLRSGLKTILRNGYKQLSYSNIWDSCESGDESENNSSEVFLIYTRTTMKKSQHVSGSSGWNREHVFAKSLGGYGESGPGADAHHLFASDNKVNGTRSNSKFGEVTNGTQVKDSLGNLTDNYTSGSTFEPCDEAKGEVARAVLYMSVMYYNTGYSTNVTNCFTSLQTCLDWNNEFPPTNREIRRNNVIYDDFQHNRNPFIDHPEFADMIYDVSYSGPGALEDNEPSISITSNLSLEIGEIANVNAVINNGSGTIVYSSSNSSVASVDSLGNVNAKAVGNATITAKTTIDGVSYSATCQVNVRQPVVLEELTMNLTSLTLDKNKTYQLSVTAIPSDASTNVNWASSNPDIASVSSDGLVKGLSIGSTIITATSVKYPSISASCTVDVIQPILPSGYVKVEENLSDWSGNYLIVYENSSKGWVFDASKGDATNNYHEVSINNNVINYEDGEPYNFIIESVSGGYVIKSDVNNAIASSSPNDLKFVSPSDTSAIMSISFQTNFIKITSNDKESVLRFNSASDQNRFRFYKSSSWESQQPIQLYKASDSSQELSPVESYCQLFLNTITCDNGVTPPSIDGWNQMKTKFNSLTIQQQNELKTASSNADNLIGLAMERYDYIINKYGIDTYENFINRAIISNGLNQQPVYDTNQILIIVIVLSVAIIPIIGGVVILKIKTK